MKYHNITKDDMLNGDGLRAVLWLAGCGHHCEGCQNPVTWDAQSGLPFDDAAKKELFDLLEKDYISGVTFTGGDPLFPANREEVFALMEEIRKRYPEKTIWMYTGESWEAICVHPALQYLDVCVDGEFLIAQADKRLLWKGSKNQRVIDVQKTLAGQNPRIPVLHCADYDGGSICRE